MIEKKKSFEDILESYRALQYMNTVFKQLCGTFMVPAYLCVAFINDILVTYVTITMYSKLPFRTYVVFPIFTILFNFFILVVFNKSSFMYSQSCKMINLKFTRTSVELNENYRKSFQYFTVDAGFFFSIKEVTVLIFFDCVIDNIVMLLTTL